jgi:hypothetical protein
LRHQDSISFGVFLAHAMIDQVFHHRLDVGRPDSPPGCSRFRKVWDGATIASDMAMEFIDSS